MAYHLCSNGHPFKDENFFDLMRRIETRQWRDAQECLREVDPRSEEYHIGLVEAAGRLIKQTPENIDFLKEIINLTPDVNTLLPGLQQYPSAKKVHLLHLAMCRGNPEFTQQTTKILFDAGACVSVAQSTGKSLLGEALDVNCMDTVAFLLEKGADPNCPGEAHTLAHHIYSPHSMKLLLNHGWKSEYASQFTWYMDLNMVNNPGEVIREMARHRVDLDAPMINSPDSKTTPLEHLVSKYQISGPDLEGISALIEMKANTSNIDVSALIERVSSMKNTHGHIVSQLEKIAITNSTSNAFSHSHKRRL